MKAGIVGILIVGMLVAGCVAEKHVEQKTAPPTVTQVPTTQRPDHEMRTLEVQPTIEYYPLGGYTGEGEEALYILSGDASTIKKSLEALVTGKAPPTTIFREDEILNLVVFRGVFSTGGHGIEIGKVEKAGNTFVVYATYTDPGKGMMVTQAFTQPTAIILIGELPKGNYEAKLKVTSIVKEEGGDKILEENKEHASVAFAVK
ncbi:MAG: protease complex subunit PrcB family protein [Candidatus Hydrothermarchaeales archaeon]